MTLPELIAALEQAEGPSRELDCRIIGFLRGYGGGDPSRWAQHVQDDAPRYSSSVDSALTLVPEGRKWSVGTWSQNFATVGAEPWMAAEVSVQHTSTPAIALCIAALKARLATEQSHG